MRYRWNVTRVRGYLPLPLSIAMTDEQAEHLAEIVSNARPNEPVWQEFADSILDELRAGQARDTGRCPECLQRGPHLSTCPRGSGNRAERDAQLRAHFAEGSRTSER